MSTPPQHPHPTIELAPVRRTSLGSTSIHSNNSSSHDSNTTSTRTGGRQQRSDIPVPSAPSLPLHPQTQGHRSSQSPVAPTPRQRPTQRSSPSTGTPGTPHAAFPTFTTSTSAFVTLPRVERQGSNTSTTSTPLRSARSIGTLPSARSPSTAALRVTGSPATHSHNVSPTVAIGTPSAWAASPPFELQGETPRGASPRTLPIGSDGPIPPPSLSPITQPNPSALPTVAHSASGPSVTSARSNLSHPGTRARPSSQPQAKHLTKEPLPGRCTYSGDTLADALRSEAVTERMFREEASIATGPSDPEKGDGGNATTHVDRASTPHIVSSGSSPQRTSRVANSAQSTRAVTGAANMGSSSTDGPPPTLSFKDRLRKPGRYGSSISGSQGASLPSSAGSPNNSTTAVAAVHQQGGSSIDSGNPNMSDAHTANTHGDVGVASPISPLPPTVASVQGNAEATDGSSHSGTANTEGGSSSTHQTSPKLSFKDRLRATSGSPVFGSATTSGAFKRRGVVFPATASPQGQRPQQEQQQSHQAAASSSSTGARQVPMREVCVSSSQREPHVQPQPPAGPPAHPPSPRQAAPHTLYPSSVERSPVTEDVALLSPQLPNERAETLVYDSRKDANAVKRSPPVKAGAAGNATHNTNHDAVTEPCVAARRSVSRGSSRAVSVDSSATNEDGSSCGTDVLACTQNATSLQVCNEEGEPQPVSLFMASPRAMELDAAAIAQHQRSTPRGSGGRKTRDVDADPLNEEEGRESGTRHPVEGQRSGTAPPAPIGSGDETGTASSPAATDREGSSVQTQSTSLLSSNAGPGAPFMGHTQTFESPTKANQHPQPSPRTTPPPPPPPRASPPLPQQQRPPQASGSALALHASGDGSASPHHHPSRSSPHKDHRHHRAHLSPSSGPAPASSTRTSTGTGGKKKTILNNTYKEADTMEASFSATRKERGKMLSRVLGGGAPLTLRGASLDHGESVSPSSPTTTVAAAATFTNTPETSSPAHPTGSSAASFASALLQQQQQPKSPAEQAADDFVHRLGLHQDQQRELCSMSRTDVDEENSDTNPHPHHSAPTSLDGTRSILDTTAMPLGGVGSDKNDDHDSGHHPPQQHVYVSDRLGDTGRSQSEMLSGTHGSFAATRENRKKSTFSSLQFSMRRRMKGRVKEQQQQQQRKGADATAATTSQPSTTVQSNQKKRVLDNPDTDSHSPRSKKRDTSPPRAPKEKSAVTAEEEEEDRMAAVGAAAELGGLSGENVEDIDKDNAGAVENDDDRDDSAESAVETKGDSRDSRQQADETEAFLAEMEADEAILQKRVGMWETAEHIFIPIYEQLENHENMEEVLSRGLHETAGSPVSGTESQSSTEFAKGSFAAGAGAVNALGAAAAAAAAVTLSPQFLSPIPSPKFSSSGSPLLHGANASTRCAGGATGMTSVASGSPMSQSQSGRGTGQGFSAGVSFMVCSPKADTATTTTTTGSPTGTNTNAASGRFSTSAKKETEGNETPQGEEVHGGAVFAFGTVAPAYNVEPAEDDPEVDCKVAARLLFDPDHGTMLLAPYDEVERYGYAASMKYNRTSTSPVRSGGVLGAHGKELTDLGASVGSLSSSSRRKGKEETSSLDAHANEEDGAEDDGACGCDENFISKDSRGMDYGKYHAHKLYDHCICCQRRPGCFLCLHCFKSLCPTHVRRHYRRNPDKCTLYMNILDIMTSFDRVFWCEKCQRFTWKYTEIYDPLVDQIAYTRGTYLPRAVRDIHCFGVETILREDVNQSPLAMVAAASMEQIPGTNSRGSMSPPTGSAGMMGLQAGGGSMSNPYGPSLYSASPRGLPGMGSTLNEAASWTASLSGRPPSASLPQQPVVYTMNADSSFSPVLAGTSLTGGITPAASPPMPPAHFGCTTLASPRAFSSGFASTNTANNAQSSTAGNAAAHPATPASGSNTRSATPPLVGTVATSHVGSMSFAMSMPAAPSASPALDASMEAAPSPMADLLHRDTKSLLEGNVLPVGNAVSKLSAVAASVQGWRTTQEDAEAAFLVYIPALKADGTCASKSAHPLASGEGSPSAGTKRESINSFTYTGPMGKRSGEHSPLPLRDARAGVNEEADVAGRTDGSGLTGGLKEENSDDDDSNAAEDRIPMGVFCVFDGHGGDAVAKLAAGHFEAHLRRAIARTRPDDIRARALLFQVKTESTAAALQGRPRTASRPPSLAASMTSPMASLSTFPVSRNTGLQAPTGEAMVLDYGGNHRVGQVPPVLSDAGSCHDRSVTAVGAPGASSMGTGSLPGAGGYRFTGPLLVPGAAVAGSSRRIGLDRRGSSPNLDSLDASPRRYLTAAETGDEGRFSTGLRSRRISSNNLTMLPSATAGLGTGEGSEGPSCVGGVPAGSAILAPVTAASLAQHVSAEEAQRAAMSASQSGSVSQLKMREGSASGNVAGGAITSPSLRATSTSQSPSLAAGIGASGPLRSPKVQAQQAQQERSSALVRQWEQESISAIVGTGSVSNASFGVGGAVPPPLTLASSTAQTKEPSPATGAENKGCEEATLTSGRVDPICSANATASASSSPHLGSASHPRGSRSAPALNPNLALSPSAVVAVSEVEMLRSYFASIMEEALLSLDDYLQHTEEGERGDYNCVGCTACIVGITPNFILCANVGDSGACFYNQNTMESIAIKHRIGDPKEELRIREAGYNIMNGRIEGMLAVPRALGDFDFKQCGGKTAAEQAVTAVPDVTIRPTPTTTTEMVATTAALMGGTGVDGDTAEDRWGILIACDGVWDTATLHQIHHALVNTPNDLDVASSATEASLRAKELARHHRRGPVHYLDDSPGLGGARSVSSSAYTSPVTSQEPGSTDDVFGSDPNQRSRRRRQQQLLANEAEKRKEGSGNTEDEEGEGGSGVDAKKLSMGGGGAASPLSLSSDPASVRRGHANEEEGCHGCDDDDASYVDDVGGDPQATDGIDPRLLTAAAGVFAQCIAPADNEEGVGLDNCSLILIERRA